MNKATLSNLLRRAGLLWAADYAKFRLQWWRQRKSNRAFRRAYPAVALPPDYTMFESFQLDYRKYYEGGRHTASWVWDQIRPHLTEPTAGRLLDWGCGPARVVRHLPTLLGAEWTIYGTDYNHQTIDWCRQHIEGVTFAENGIDPPLSFPDEFFDALYGISIFTHLSEGNHLRWFRELLRVCKPGAILFLTTHGPVFRARLTSEERIQFDQGRLVVRAQVTEGHRLFGAFHPPDYMRKLFSKGATILRYQPGAVMDWGLEQDTWVLRKEGEV